MGRSEIVILFIFGLIRSTRKAHGEIWCCRNFYCVIIWSLESVLYYMSCLECHQGVYLVSDPELYLGVHVYRSANVSGLEALVYDLAKPMGYIHNLLDRNK